jgi:hypothetical protein
MSTISSINFLSTSGSNFANESPRIRYKNLPKFRFEAKLYFWEDAMQVLMLIYIVE